MSTTKSCASNGGAGCSRGFAREKCQKCSLGSIACDMCHAGSLVAQHFHNHHHHQLLQQHQLNQQQPNQQNQQKQRRGSKDNNNYEHHHHRLSSSSSTASSSSRPSSACSTPTKDSPRSSLSIEAASPIAGCGTLATTTTAKVLQRTGSGSAPTGDTAPPPSAVNSTSVPLPTASSSSAGGLPHPSLSPSQAPCPPLSSAIQVPQILSPSPRPMKIKTFSISYQLPLPSGHPQKSLVSSSPVSPIPAKDISLSMITDYPYPSYTRSAPSSPTANMTGPLFFATTRSSTSPSPPFFPRPTLSISSSIPPSSPTTITTTTPRSRLTPPLPPSTYSVPSSPSPYGPSSLPCIFCFNGRKACEECFGLGYVQRICQECLRDRHRQQSRRRMKHTSLPNAWNQFGTKIKEQLFSHSSTTMAAVVSSNATTVPGTPAAATTATIATTTGTNGNASSSSTSPPFSSSMFFPLQRRNTSANTRTGGITLPIATTVKSGIAGLSLKNKWQSQQRSKSMVSLPLITNPPSLSGHSSSPTTPTAVAPPSSSLVPSTALIGTASLSSASNAMIAMTGTTTIMTAGSGAGMSLRPVDDSECGGTESRDWKNLNSSNDATSEEGDNDDAGVGGREGKGKKVIGHGESSINNSNNNNNSQLIPTTTMKKSFKATVIGALKLSNLNLFQGHLRSTTTSTTTLSNNTNNNNDNSRSRRMVREAGGEQVLVGA